MRRFVELELDHMLAVEWDDQPHQSSYVTLTQFEGACRHGKYSSLRIRLRDAWRTFKGDGRCWEEMYRVEHVDALIATLQEARQNTWPERDEQA